MYTYIFTIGDLRSACCAFVVFVVTKGAPQQTPRTHNGQYEVQNIWFDLFRFIYIHHHCSLPQTSRKWPRCLKPGPPR